MGSRRTREQAFRPLVCRFAPPTLPEDFFAPSTDVGFGEAAPQRAEDPNVRKGPNAPQRIIRSHVVYSGEETAAGPSSALLAIKGCFALFRNLVADQRMIALTQS
jgi:hypothetical protein